ncbi:hypothetical protein MB27_28100 [Actinoplanes utahensis]|uniref:Uncharacterized protein n=1 Tax=Actinoplanes utahensis TaxID=1869 RepID=A0A0A6UGI3_ACTUT|nr:hypothetical protein MB27_28100 [Actinoplanes utahensis]
MLEAALVVGLVEEAENCSRGDVDVSGVGFFFECIGDQGADALCVFLWHPLLLWEEAPVESFGDRREFQDLGVERCFALVRQGVSSDGSYRSDLPVNVKECAHG